MRSVAIVAVSAAMLTACGSEAAGLSDAVRAAIGEDLADCVESELDDGTIRTLNGVFDSGPASLPADAAASLSRATQQCLDGTADGVVDEPTDTTTTAPPSASDPTDDVGSIGQDPVDPDATVVAGRDTPLPLGSTVTLAGWDITVLDGRQETGDLADRSSEGGLYVITVRGVNRSGGESDLFFDVDWGTIAADGTIYENSCGVALPDDLAFVDSAPQGGTQEGSFCLTMPEATAAAVTDFYLQEALTDIQAIAWFTTR